MAIHTERNEVVFTIVARMATKLLMVYFKVGPGSAELAAPPVALKNALAEFFVVVSSQPDRHLLLQKLVHCVSPFTSCCTNACL